MNKSGITRPTLRLFTGSSPESLPLKHKNRMPPGKSNMEIANGFADSIERLKNQTIARRFYKIHIFNHDIF